MQIHFVTGKGGVGKSVFSLALATQLSKKFKRTLLVELGDESFFSYFLKVPLITYKPTAIQGLSFDLGKWDGASALSEYVLHLIKIETLHRLFFENQVTRSLVNAAPGLKELALLGKITSGPPRKVGPPLPYDCLVIDAFSSGHFLALLKAPIGMSETFRVGPMGEQSRSILKTIQSPELSHIHVVTLPEYIPAQESLDLIQDLNKICPQTTPKIWINKWINYPPCQGTGLVEHFWVNQTHLQNEALNKLRQFKPQKISFQFELDPYQLINKISSEVQL